MNPDVPADKPISRGQKFAESRLFLRKELWPKVEAEDVWNRKRTAGFTTIPRPMSLILVIIDTLSVGKPLSSTYLDLWCRAYDEGFVKLDKPHEMAFASGFISSRGPHIWAERLDRLEHFGFIKLAPGSQGKRSFALIFNPYKVIKNLKKTEKISAALHNALLSAADAVGATDIPASQPDRSGPWVSRMKQKSPAGSASQLPTT